MKSVRPIGVKFVAAWCCLFPSFVVGETKPTLSSLGQLEWQNRIILVRPAGDLASVRLALAKEKTAIDDRDILWFILGKRNDKEDSIESNFRGEIEQGFAKTVLMEHFDTQGHLAVLIGKDGTVKLKQNKLNLNEIFALIDTMPMRIREMSE